MRARIVAAALMLCGSALMAGCPLAGLGDLGGLLEGLVSGESGDWQEDWDETHPVIKDGTYSGSFEATTDYWQAGAGYWDSSWSGSVTHEFFMGEILRPSGNWIDFGDVDTLDMGTLQITREVYDIQVPDWGYELTFDLTATWSNMPFTGVQSVGYYLNSDGSVSMYDTIELTSRDDGGVWEILIEAEGTLEPTGSSGNGGSGGFSGNPLDHPILDKKSG